ncbi:shikimate dehydrogenase [Pelagibacteraceae bacterium]|nr:shikimate dehydrogenase [Pelagibacteraceae bacterium]
MTKKNFAIIGKPITHSLSPTLHNYWFKKYNINANYSLIDLDEENINNTIGKIRNKELDGINVTLPYKQKVISHIDKLVNDAKHTNSVNTIFLDSSNTVVGENTDVFGLQAAYLKEITETKNKKVLVIGAGGVSPSVIFSLQKSNFQNISVINRTKDKSLFLKKKFNLTNILDWNKLEEEISNFDIIINATSLGLKNNNDFEVNFKNTKNNLIYIDTIYNPIETKTLKILKEKKLKTFNGLNMFIYQGQKSFYLWNKINPEIDDELIDILISKLK